MSFDRASVNTMTGRNLSAARLLPAAGWLLLSAVLVRTAWLCDDAYITFRVIDNFVHGRGLVWNVAERVLPSTHPLWLLLLSPLTALSGEVFYTSLLLSLLLSAAAAAVAAAAVGRRPGPQVVLLLALAGSRAFTDFASSGLETPLTYLLLALFLCRWLRDGIDSRAYCELALLAGLAALNRMDSLLLFLPALVAGFRTVGRRSGLRALALGFAPLLVWEIFSCWYYGAPFPNSAYAKLGAGVPPGELLGRGGTYLVATFQGDPLTPLLILAAIALAARRRDERSFPIALGIVLQLLYTVRIGGDFMMGRFLAAPFLAAAVLLARRPCLDDRRATALAAAVVLGLGLAAPDPTWLSGPHFGAGRADARGAGGVADERAVYFPHTSLLGAAGRAAPVDMPWANNGLRARLAGTPVVQKRTIGFFGYYAGPTVHIIDLFGLADPLLARLPGRRDPEWRLGHLERTVPEGYEASLATNRNQIADPHLARYYDAVRTATRGDLTDLHRLLVILKLNLGFYDRDRAGYLPGPGAGGAAAGPLTVRAGGMEQAIGATVAASVFVRREEAA